MVVTPIWVLVFSTFTIKSLNEKYYGMYIEKDTAVGSVCTALYSVKAKENYPRVDNPREEIYRVYEVSETLNSIRDSLEISLDKLTSLSPITSIISFIVFSILCGAS